MTRDHQSDRKVRGEQIRNSRGEKRTDRDENSRETVTQGSELTARSDQFGTDELVETEAVAAVRTRVERWVTAGRPVHLIGPTGCGKTAMAMHVAQRRDRPVVFINGDAELTTADLVGEYAETERESVRDRYVHNVMKSKDVVRDRWVDNPLTVAAREGATLVYNEFARTKPTANNVLLSVFEEGVLELPGRRGDSRYVDVHPEFRAVFTSNSAEYAGIHTPQDALLDRLIGVHMDFYDHETELAIVTSRVDGVTAAEAKQIVGTLRAIRDSEDIEITVSTRAMVMVAEGVAAAPSITESVFIELCVDALSSKVPKRSELSRLQTAIETVVERQRGDTEVEAIGGTSETR